MNNAPSGITNWNGPGHVWDGLERAGFRAPTLYVRHIQGICEELGLADNARDAVASFCRAYLAAGAQLPNINEVSPCVVSWVDDARHTPKLRTDLATQIRMETSDTSAYDVFDDGAPIDELLDRIMLRSRFEVGEQAALSRSGYFISIPSDGLLWLVLEKRRLHNFEAPGKLPLSFVLQIQQTVIVLDDLKFVVPGVSWYFMPEDRDSAVLGLCAIVCAGELLAESLSDIKSRV
jgi:hypothetical protein